MTKISRKIFPINTCEEDFYVHKSNTINTFQESRVSRIITDTAMGKAIANGWRFDMLLNKFFKCNTVLQRV